MEVDTNVSHRVEVTIFSHEGPTRERKREGEGGGGEREEHVIINNLSKKF